MWMPVKNYENLYLVSDDGDIYSLITDRVLKPSKKRGGYLQVTLSNDGKLEYKSIHTLVADAFIPNPENKKQVNHKDGNKQNNSVENLEWCTCQENILHCIYTLGKHKVPVNQISKSGRLIRTWDSIIEASKGTGIKAQHIWRNAQGIRQSTGGYIFQYAEERRN